MGENFSYFTKNPTHQKYITVYENIPNLIPRYIVIFFIQNSKYLDNFKDKMLFLLVKKLFPDAKKADFSKSNECLCELILRYRFQLNDNGITINENKKSSNYNEEKLTEKIQAYYLKLVAESLKENPLLLNEFKEKNSKYFNEELSKN